MKKIEEVTNYQNAAFLCSFSSVFTLSPCPSERKVLAFSQRNPNFTTENTDRKQHLADTSCSDFLIYSSQHHNYMLWNNSTPSPMLLVKWPCNNNHTISSNNTSYSNFLDYLTFFFYNILCKLLQCPLHPTAQVILPILFSPPLYYEGK